MSGDVTAPEDDTAPPAPVDRRSRLGRAGRALLAVPTPVVFVVSVLVAVVLLWRQGTLGDLGDVARDTNRWVAAGGFALYLGGLALLCARWHVLVLMVRGLSDAARAAEAFLTSVVVNYAAPIGLAVPTRAALTKRSLGLSPAETGAVAVWEVALDVVVLGAGTLLWLASTDAGGEALDEADGVNVRVLAGAAVALVVIAAATAVGLTRSERTRRLAQRGAVAVAGTLRYPGERPRDAARALVVTVAYWLVQGLVLRLLLGASGVGGDAGPSLILGLVTLPVLVGMLSPVPGGAGIREALMVAVAQGEGANGAAVLLAAVAYRVALFLAVPVLYVAVRAWTLLRDRRVTGRPSAPTSREVL